MSFYVLQHWERYASLTPVEGVDDSESLAVRLLEKGETLQVNEDYIPIEVLPDKKNIGDLAHWRSVVLSQRAVDVLRPLLSDIGIFYPLNVKNAPQPYWLFIVTNVIDCLDEDRSEGHLTEVPLSVLRAHNYDMSSISIYWEPDVKFSCLDKVVLKPSALEGRRSTLFKLPYYGNRYIIVNDDFRLAIERNGLVGFVLIPEGFYLNGDMRKFIINKGVKPLKGEGSFRSESVSAEGWVNEIKQLSQSGDGDFHKLRARVYENFSAELDDRGLENFYYQVGKMTLSPSEQSAVFGPLADEGMEKYICELEKSICELKKIVKQNGDISAVYFEYYYDGGEISGNFFLCTDYDQDSDDWRTLFNGKEGVVLGPQLPACFSFDLSDEKRIFATEIVDGLLAAQLLRLWKKNKLQKYPLAYASHGKGMVLLVK